MVCSLIGKANGCYPLRCEFESHWASERGSIMIDKMARFALYVMLALAVIIVVAFFAQEIITLI
jgi:hypothetical protein